MWSKGHASKTNVASIKINLAKVTSLKDGLINRTSMEVNVFKLMLIEASLDKGTYVECG